MCATCGCESNGHSIVHGDDHGHAHDHHHDHDHSHSHSTGKSVVEVEKDILHHNNLLAARNRGYFDAKYSCPQLSELSGFRKNNLT
jgi:hydrogenase nickel incorporation protein HypB